MNAILINSQKQIIKYTFNILNIIILTYCSICVLNIIFNNCANKNEEILPPVHDSELISMHKINIIEDSRNNSILQSKLNNIIAKVSFLSISDVQFIIKFNDLKNIEYIKISNNDIDSKVANKIIKELRVVLAQNKYLIQNNILKLEIISNK